jgi:uncharacterized protein with NRDE domain
MSLLAIVYHLVPEAPILVAYNREEPLDRICPAPSIQSGKPRILASIDQHTGGTYLGMNQNGMFVGVVRRKKFETPVNPRSRGALTREMLKCNSAQHAVDLALEELHTGQYGGGNFCVADPDSGWMIHSHKETDATELEQGLCIIGDKDMNDPRRAGGDGSATSDVADVGFPSEVSGDRKQSPRASTDCTGTSRHGGQRKGLRHRQFDFDFPRQKTP